MSRIRQRSGRNIKKKLLLRERGQIYNQVSCLFSNSTSLDSYQFRGIQGGEIPRDRTCTAVGYRLVLLLFPAVVLEFILAQHCRNKKERKKQQNRIPHSSEAQQRLVQPGNHLNTYLNLSTFKIQQITSACALELCWSGQKDWEKGDFYLFIYLFKYQKNYQLHALRIYLVYILQQHRCERALHHISSLFQHWYVHINDCNMCERCRIWTCCLGLWQQVFSWNCTRAKFRHKRDGLNFEIRITNTPPRFESDLKPICISSWYMLEKLEHIFPLPPSPLLHEMFWLQSLFLVLKQAINLPTTSEK